MAGRQIRPGQRRRSSAPGPGRVTGRGAGRYTPPTPRNVRVSPKWMGFLILGLLIAGLVVVVLNYVSILPGGASNWYLVVGLVLIVAGFVVATNYH